MRTSNSLTLMRWLRSSRRSISASTRLETAARAFLEDPSLEDAVGRGGVEGEPGVAFIERAEQKTYVDSAVA